MTHEEWIAVRFWPKVNKSGGPDACWSWTASRTATGYGRIKRHGSAPMYAHRVAYEAAHGPIPKGMCVCHRCDNPPCCNPAHLWLGTQADNNVDKASKGRSAHYKLTAEDVVKIRASNESHAHMARVFAVVPSTIRKIRAGDVWKFAYRSG